VSTKRGEGQDAYYDLLNRCFSRFPMDEMSDEDFMKYENTKYPENYLRIKGSVYIDEDEGYYFLKMAEKIYCFTDKHCDCLKLFLQ